MVSFGQGADTHDQMRQPEREKLLRCLEADPRVGTGDDGASVLYAGILGFGGQLDGGAKLVSEEYWSKIVRPGW